LVAEQFMADRLGSFGTTGLPRGARAAMQSCGSRGAEMLALDATEGIVFGIDRLTSYTAEASVFTASERWKS
jgi:hypothetical protein